MSIPTGNSLAAQQNLEQLTSNVYALTSENLPNTGIVLGQNEVLLFNPLAIPGEVEQVQKQLDCLTGLPVRYLVYSDFYPVTRVERATFPNAVAIVSHATDELTVSHGEEEWRIALQRFPFLEDVAPYGEQRLAPGIIVDECLILELGQQRVFIFHPGAGHTGGDLVLWVPDQKILFSGGLVTWETSPFCGDAYLQQWLGTLKLLSGYEPEYIVPGYGTTMKTTQASLAGIENTRRYVSKLYCYADEVAQGGQEFSRAYQTIRNRMSTDFASWYGFERNLPANAMRALEEVSGVEQPKPRTVEKEQALWSSLQYI